MSWPGVRGDVERPRLIHVTWTNRYGNELQGIFKGIDAIVLEHEIDHLDGIRCIDKMVFEPERAEFPKGNAKSVATIMAMAGMNTTGAK